MKIYFERYCTLALQTILVCMMLAVFWAEDYLRAEHQKMTTITGTTAHCTHKISNY
jgi:hypothetical protein